jgi:2-phosphosulfolactate phosphatase
VPASSACDDGPVSGASTGPRSRAEAGIYGQTDFGVRFDWGPDGADAVASGVDIVVVVDVLSFTTAVSVATARGALIFPYPWEDGATEFAASKHADLAGNRAKGGLSLSPVSLTKLQRNDRVVLSSPNGATICWRLAAAGVPVIAGCLRNASAVGKFLASRGPSVAVIAGGERWAAAAVGIRPSLEDLLGAGAVLSGLPQNECSPEALAAVAAYQRFERNLPETLMSCVGGRELAAWGYPEDVGMAAAFDADPTVPVLTDEGCFAAES